MWMRWRTQIEPHSSIALVGLPGVGKSTLGVIAAGSLGMKLVETDRCFHTKTGHTPGEYSKAYGKEALQVKELEILRLVLERHATGCIIAVATRTSDTPGCRRLIEQFSTCHAVIHVARDPKQVAEYLRRHVCTNDVLTKYDACVQQYRAIANYEFYVYEKVTERRVDSRGIPTPSFLSLKDVERDFLGLLRFISGKPRNATFLAAPEDTEFSRILVVPFPLDESDLNFSGIHGVHAVQLRFHFPTIHRLDWADILNRISRVSAAFRTDCLHPLALSIGDAFGSSTHTLEDEQKYFGLLAHAVSLGFDYCYVDLHASRNSIMHFLQNTATTRVIATWHHDNAAARSPQSGWWQSSKCLSTYWMAVDLGCQVLQMSSRAANAMSANFDAVSCAHALGKMSHARAPKLSIFNTGDAGRLSRILNRVLTPVVRDSDAAIFRASAAQGDMELEGVITLQEVQSAMCYSLMAKNLKFCSFGAVISHSVGPAIHNAAFKVLGLPYEYGITESRDLDEALALTRSEDMGGFSVANPYKETMLPLLDEVSDHARAIKAVNTVYTRSAPLDGHRLVCGENTDWIGIVTTIQHSLSPINAVTPKTTALVIGGGGMARAAIYGLLHLGLTAIMILNRTIEKAETIAKDFSLVSGQLVRDQRFSTQASIGEPRPCAFTILSRADDIHDKRPAITPPTIIVNALTDGDDQPVSSVFDLPIAWFSRPTGGVYIEVSSGNIRPRSAYANILQTAYKFQQSTLREKVENLAFRNWIYVGGQELLVEQALPQTELWTGMSGARKVMRTVIGL